jgi:hypothetical protein
MGWEMTWVIYSLTPWGEKEDTSLLEKDIKKYLGEVETFIPALKNHEGLNLTLVDGYIFVNTEGVPEYKLFKLENTRFIKSLLTENQRTRDRLVRRMHFVTADYVNGLRSQFRDIFKIDIRKGHFVFIRGGLYRNLEGLVVETGPKSSSILIEMRSVTILIETPNCNLQKAE